MKLLSIIIIEYLSLDEIKNCLEKIATHLNNIDYEVIVSSNSLYDIHTQENIEKKYSGIQWRFNKENGGFAYGMNEGLKYAQGKYLAILNPDVIICNNLNPIIDFMEENPFVGAIAPQIIDEKGNIQDSCRPYVTLPRFIWRQIKRIFLRKDSVLQPHFDYSKIQTVDWLIGAFILVSRTAYKATGGLNSNFFMYAEDIDWCTRIRKCGYEIVYFPKVQIKYKGSRSARNSSKYAKIFLKSHIGYWRKYGLIWVLPKRRNIKFQSSINN